MIGLEPTPEAFIEKMVAVFREVRRVLRSDGTCWVNLGDSYAGSWGNQGRKPERGTQRPINGPMMQPLDGRYPQKESNTGAVPAGLKAKDLCMMPARVALALQADGWYLRSQIIWAKGLSFCPSYSGSVMPESCRDRPTSAYEVVYLLAKSARYFWDADVVRERAEFGGDQFRAPRYCNNNAHDNDAIAEKQTNRHVEGQSRNLRNVWAINPQAFSEAHFATFPEKLVEPMVKAGTSEKGCCPECGKPWERVVEREFEQTRPTQSHHEVNDRKLSGRDRTPGNNHATTLGFRPACECCVAQPGDVEEHYDLLPNPCTVLDPFSGSGTTGVVACRLGRDYIGIELNPEYAKMSERRIGKALRPATYRDMDTPETGTLFDEAPIP